MKRRDSDHDWKVYRNRHRPKGDSTGAKRPAGKSLSQPPPPDLYPLRTAFLNVL
jgi:hypothetical protein